eukprot:GCRY01001245.1.p1 GENE.GCRY01001245.1~~GCRY01001245.1.p1  ORF type:complete len:391 (-),score=26.67 GCRY01001245.1:133-1248(-)
MVYNCITCCLFNCRLILFPHSIVGYHHLLHLPPGIFMMVKRFARVLFLCLCVAVISSQRLSSDGIVQFKDLKLQNEKLTETIAQLRANIEDNRAIIARAVNTSCYELKRQYPSAPSGVYEIYPFTGDGNSQKESVYCEMEIANGGWTLVQRTVWNCSDSQQLITNYDDFRTVSVGDPHPSKAYRLAAQYWPHLYKIGAGNVDNLFSFYLRDETASFCSSNDIGEGDTVMVTTPLIHATVGTRWNFPPVQDESTGISTVGAAASFGSDPGLLFNANGDTGFISLTASNAQCNKEKVAPFQYTSCCFNCPLYNLASSVWSEDCSHSMVCGSITDTSDLNGNTRMTVAPSGGCTWNLPSNGLYYGVAAWEYYVR